jgi:hypothetical protein
MEIIGKILDYNSIEVSGINPGDYPDFVDAYISYAEWIGGGPLSDEELDELNDTQPEIAQSIAMDDLIGRY